MKRLLAGLLIATLLLTLAACAGSGSYVNYGSPLATTGGPSEPSDPTVPSESTEPSEPSTPTEPETAAPFTNTTNYQNAPIGEVSIQPKYVYWENGMLIAECFVCNGTDKAISNINVESLSFAGNTGDLATASFGVCSGLTLGSMKYEEWTFSFPADCVSQYGADLSHLNTAWSIRFSS